MRWIPHRAGQAGGFRRARRGDQGLRHWLMDEAPAAVMPALMDFVRW